MAYSPKRPTGDTPEALFVQWVYDSIKALQPLKTPTVRFDRTKDGIFYHSAAGGGLAGSPLLQCIITSLFDEDYIGVTQYDTVNGNVTGSEFLCAKAFAGRMPDLEVIDGILITYEYFSENQRMASSQGYQPEVHMMHPRYANAGVTTGQQLVCVMKVAGPPIMYATDQEYNGQPINYIEISPREWTLNSQPVS